MYRKISVYAKLEDNLEQRNGFNTKSQRRTWWRLAYCSTDHFKCPRCHSRVTLRVQYKRNALFRSSVCPSCGLDFCLQFKNNACKICRHRKVDCLLKATIKLKIVYQAKKDGLYHISQGRWPLSTKEIALESRMKDTR